MRPVAESAPIGYKSLLGSKMNPNAPVLASTQAGADTNESDATRTPVAPHR